MKAAMVMDCAGESCLIGVCSLEIGAWTADAVDIAFDAGAIGDIALVID